MIDSISSLEIGRAYAVVRCAKLCHEFYPTRLYPGGVDETEIVVWYAARLMGNYISGHPGLDLVFILKNIGSNNQRRVWNTIRRALVALDPTYAGEEEAFCEAYAAGDYARACDRQPCLRMLFSDADVNLVPLVGGDAFVDLVTELARQDEQRTRNRQLVAD